jgi:hypothetical protein
MKWLFRVLAVLTFSNSHAQTKEDSVRQIQQWAGWYDLKVTPSESDSMLSSLQELSGAYQSMHKTLPPNSLPFPFAFQPAPFGTVIPQNQQKIKWPIPTNVALPANKDDLSFYSLSQLASLIKSKKITSIALTTFFLERLKKWAIP